MAGKKVIGDKERGTRRSDGVGGGKQGHGDKEEARRRTTAIGACWESKKQDGG